MVLLAAGSGTLKPRTGGEGVVLFGTNNGQHSVPSWLVSSRSIVQDPQVWTLCWFLVHGVIMTMTYIVMCVSVYGRRFFFFFFGVVVGASGGGVGGDGEKVGWFLLFWLAYFWSDNELVTAGIFALWTNKGMRERERSS